MVEKDFSVQVLHTSALYTQQTACVSMEIAHKNVFRCVSYIHPTSSALDRLKLCEINE